MKAVLAAGAAGILLAGSVITGSFLFFVAAMLLIFYVLLSALDGGQ